MTTDQVFEQLEVTAARQFPGDEIGRLKCLVSMLKTKILESEYRAEKATEFSNGHRVAG